jgi:sugar/nucleoside kinase (ribokinase family)
VPHYPTIREDVEVSQLERGPGGSAANFAVAVARIGFRSAFIGKVGSDEDGRFLYEGLRQEGVDVSHLRFGGRTGAVLVVVDGDGQRTMFSFRGSTTNYGPDEVDGDLIASSSILHVSGYAFIHAPQREAALRAMEYAREANVPVSLDPSPHINLAEQNTVARAVRLTTLMLPDLAEAQVLTNQVNPEDAANKLLNLGPKIVALKLGEHGSMIVKDDQRLFIPALRVDAVDTTGAGDAFDAGFIAGFLKGWTLRVAGEFANATAALKITRKGARTGLPRLDEVTSFLHAQSKVISS